MQSRKQCSQKMSPGSLGMLPIEEFYFAHVERVSDCLKRPEHVNCLRVCVAGPEQMGTEEMLVDSHQSFISVFIQQTCNKHLLCAGTGLGAENPSANNKNLTGWWARK